MKQKILTIVAACCLFISASATIHTVGVNDYQFAPNTLTVNTGDTILWQWFGGNHTTTSGVIPTGATSWNSPLNSTTPSFMYVPTKAGVYNYVCSFHASMGMTGTFTAIYKAAVGQLAKPEIFTIYPNPARDQFHLLFNYPGLNVKITLIDANGLELRKKEYLNVNEGDLYVDNIPNGIYTIKAEQGNASYREQVVIHH